MKPIISNTILICNYVPLTIVFILTTAEVSASNIPTKVVNIGNMKSPIDLHDYSLYYSTKDTSTNIYSVLSKEFVYNKKGVKGINDNTIYWKRVILNNDTDVELKFYVYFPYSVSNKIIAYSKYGETIEHIASLGMQYSRKDKEINSIGYPVPVVLKPGKTTLYIYLKTFNLAIRTNSFLLSSDELRETVRADEKLIWFWKGVFVLATLIALSLFVVTGYKMFIYYFLLNIGVGTLFLAEMGEMSNYFDIVPFNLIANFKQSGTLLGLIAFPLLINQITPIAKLRPRLWKIMQIATFVIGLSWLGCLIPYLLTNKFLLITTYIYNFVGPVLLILQLYFIFVAYKKKERNSKYILVGYSGYFLALFIYIILPNLGLLETDLHIYNTFIYGSLFEIVMFMSILGKETLSMYQHRSLLLEKQKKHQSDIIKAIVESQEKERNIVGREIHDLIGANISIIKLKTDTSNKPLIEIINKTIKHTRDLSHGLVTPMIKKDEFLDEINDLCQLFTNDNFEVTANFYNWTEIKDENKAIHIYRIIQELLNNALKHSGASKVFLQFITNNEEELVIMYEDDGKGFDYAKTYKSKGLGLINIENRIKLIEATISFDTAKNKGTTIIIEMPINRSKAQ